MISNFVQLEITFVTVRDMLALLVGRAMLARMPLDYDPDDYVTPAEAARLWKIKPDAVRKAIRTGRIPDALQTPSGRWLIPKRRLALRATGGNTGTSTDQN